MRTERSGHSLVSLFTTTRCWFSQHYEGMFIEGICSDFPSYRPMTLLAARSTTAPRDHHVHVNREAPGSNRFCTAQANSVPGAELETPWRNAVAYLLSHSLFPDRTQQAWRTWGWGWAQTWAVGGAVQATRTRGEAYKILFPNYLLRLLVG